METKFPKPEELNTEEKASFQVLLSSMDIIAKTYHLNTEKKAYLLSTLLEKHNELPKILCYNLLSELLLTQHLEDLNSIETEQKTNFMVI